MKPLKSIIKNLIPRSLLIVLIGVLQIYPTSGQEQDLPLNLGFKLLYDKKKAEIPIELHNNLVVVPVILNKKLPLKFILDTGVRTAILTDKLYSDILNLNYSRKREIMGAGGEKVIDAYVANNVTIELPGVVGEGHALFVLEEDLLQLRNYLGSEVHGILGYELFSRFVVEINYTRKRLVIRDPERFSPKRRYQRVPIQIEDTKPYVNSVISLYDGEPFPVKLMIDTGASHALLLLDESSDKITIPDKNIEANLGRGLSGEINGLISRIECIQFGDFHLENPVTSFPYPDSYPKLLTNIQRNGTIGGGITSRFNIVFNFSEEEIYLKKNSDFRKDFYYNMSGLVIRAKGADLSTFEVTDVKRNSEGAEAGIEEGDIIMEINGSSTEELKLNNVLGFLNSRPNRKITMVLKRNGKEYRTTFRLKDII